MPEELNRILTDQAADLLLCPSEDTAENLAVEGIPSARVAIVGNTMIDSLLRLLPAALASSPLGALGLKPRGYVLVTLHRPSLVDDIERLVAVLHVLERIAARLPVVLPLHPRTRRRLDAAGEVVPAGVIGLDPLEYKDFIALEAEARLVITDSGGVQEEATVLGVPCLTFRDSTERPVTVTLGTNTLVGTDPERLYEFATRALGDAYPRSAPAIPLWDGAAGFRAAEIVSRLLEGRATGTGVTAR
jgi:UDP-N-acetylglucosamine 2-epimerase (non-hydrolysing)